MPLRAADLNGVPLEPYGDHRPMVAVSRPAPSHNNFVSLSAGCPVCGAWWTCEVGESAELDPQVRSLLLSRFSGAFPESCKESRRLLEVAEVMES